MSDRNVDVGSASRLFRQLMCLAGLGVAMIQVYDCITPKPIAWNQVRVKTIAIDPEGEFEQQMGWK